MIDSVKIPVTTTGSAGSATGTAYSGRPVHGEVRAIHLDWSASAPGATSDVTVTFEADGDHPAITIYAKTDSVADAIAYPVVQCTDTGGSAVSGQYTRIVGQGRIKVVVAQCDALDPALTVYVYLDDLR